MENVVKVWDTETGQNVANLKGHQGNIHSIKAAYDGSFAVSVGTDRTIQLWDLRSSRSVGHIEVSNFSEMNEICLGYSEGAFNRANGI
jgi:WD40 repeat protein